MFVCSCVVVVVVVVVVVFWGVYCFFMRCLLFVCFGICFVLFYFVFVTVFIYIICSCCFFVVDLLLLFGFGGVFNN